MSESLQYQELDVPPALASHVRCLWRMSGAASVATTPEPIIPDGCSEIVLNFGDPFVRHTEGGSHRQPRSLVAGQITRAITIEPSGRVDLWGIRFQPWAAAPLLGVSGAEMRDCLTALDDVAPELSAELQSAADAPGTSQQRERIVGVLTRRVSRARAVDARLPRLAALVAERRDAVTVRAVARETGLGVRRVQQLFRDDVGLSPKQLHRITRFQRALVLGRAQTSLTWSAIALRAGYYDQAHLIHESRDIVGLHASRAAQGATGRTSSRTRSSRAKENGADPKISAVSFFT